MKNIEITNPIVIKYKILLPKNIFEGSEIYQNGVEVSCKCPNCTIDNSFQLNENSGELLEDLFLKKKLISKADLLKNNVAKEAPKLYKYLGELTVFQNLSALYLFLKCDNCDSKFILVFSFGESQPNRVVCYISGLWLINED